MKSKFLLFLVLILAVSTLLIACGGDDPDDTTAPATSAPATSEPATQAPATSAPATQAPATSAPATSAPVTQAPSIQEPIRTDPPVTTAKPATPVTPPNEWSDSVQ